MQQKSELPEGWTISNLNEISDDIKYGYTASAEMSAVGPHLLRITDIQDGRVDWENVPFCKIKEEKIPNYELKSNDIVFARTGATTGKSYLISSCPRSVFASYLIRLRPNENIDPMFLSLFFNTNDYWEQISQNISGIAQPNCNATKLKELILPLPPLSEQHRIVSVIEALFARLDATNERLNRVLEILKVFRQEVLNNLYEGFRRIPFSDIVSTSQNGIAKRSGKEGTEFKVLRLADINNLKIDYSNPRCIKLTSSEIEKHKLFKNDLICIRVNGSKNLVGRLILADEKDELSNWAFCDHFIRISLDTSKTISKFYSYFFQTTEVREYIQENMVSSAGQNTVSQKTINSTLVPAASLHEQQKIIRRVDALFAFADSIEEKVAAAREKTEKLRQSILAKAFSGELVETEAEISRREGRDYETAEVLIERIKAEKKIGKKK